MIEAYEGIVDGRKNYNEVLGEVAEDSSAHASFMTKNNVSNDPDVVMTQMQNDIASVPFSS